MQRGQVLDEALRQTIQQRLQQFELRQEPVEAQKSAAVALILVEQGFGPDLNGFSQYDTWQKTPAMVLTTRSSRLRNHPGQWALPGGRRDTGETLLGAAIRETSEEIGLSLKPEDVIGQLDDFVTRSGYVMTPIVFWAGKAENLTPNPNEVETIHRIPLQEFLREDAPMLDHEELKAHTDQQHPVLRMPVGDTWIAAPTAAILYQFREVCLLARDTRVAHFEQPHFAWT